jgi:hypothetical protein
MGRLGLGFRFATSFDRAALAPVLAGAIGRKSEMRITTVAIGAACLALGAGGATLYTHAAAGPAFYTVYETTVTDQDA